MSSTPAVTVVIPVYNKAAYVRRAVDSVLAQTRGDFELIVIDDGSTDHSRAVVMEVQDPRLRVLSQPNAGPGAARNRGLAEARAPLVAWLDADDEWMPRFLERAFELLEAHSPQAAGVVQGYLERPAGVDRVALWQRRGIREGPFRFEPGTDPMEAVHRTAYLTPCSTVLRTEAARRWGGFFDKFRCIYGEDAHFWFKVLLNESIVFSLEPQTAFHTDASQLSRNLQGMRPIEPFLLDPDDLVRSCPDGLKPLLEAILAIRAAKTAGLLALHGRWRDARGLVRRFVKPRHLRLPYCATATLMANPAGSFCARAAWKAWRGLAGRKSPAPGGQPAEHDAHASLSDREDDRGEGHRNSPDDSTAGRSRREEGFALP
jgi:hypothetical protein